MTSKKPLTALFSKSFLAIAFIVLSSASLCFGQEEITVAGRVLDKNTKEPIPGANIFISNTLFGASTNVEGEFSFKISPQDNYELVASHISYQPLVSPVSSFNNLSELVIELEENIDELNEVIITFSNKDWNKQLRDFKREFIGTTRNSAGCKLLNPEVLHFEYDEKTDLLTAEADDLLKIENNALGYMVSHLLVEFKYQNGKVSYSSKTRFEELTHKNRMKERKWKKAQKSTYLGSLNHFLHAVTQNTLKENGFKVFEVNSLTATREKTRFNANSVLQKTDSLYILDFKNYLEVVYKELEERSFSSYKEKGNRHLIRTSSYEREQQVMSPQTSILEINSPLGYIVIKSGKLADPGSIIEHGYWGWKRTGDLLPVNYLPNE